MAASDVLRMEADRLNRQLWQEYERGVDAAQQEYAAAKASLQKLRGRRQRDGDQSADKRELKLVASNKLPALPLVGGWVEAELDETVPRAFTARQAARLTAAANALDAGPIDTAWTALDTLLTGPAE